MMTAVSSCTWLFIFICYCIKRGTASLVHERRTRSQENYHAIVVLLSAILVSVPTFTRIGRASLWNRCQSRVHLLWWRPTKFLGELLPPNCSIDSQLPLLPDGGDFYGDWYCNITARHRNGWLHRQPLCQSSVVSGAVGYAFATHLCFLWLKSWWLVSCTCSLCFDHTCTCLMSQTCYL